MTVLNPETRAMHWRRTRNLMFVHLGIWFIFAFVVHWFAYSLNSVSFFGWPLGYYFAAQGSRMGEVALSANAILLNFLMISAFFLDGLAQARHRVAPSGEFGIDATEKLLVHGVF